MQHVNDYTYHLNSIAEHIVVGENNIGEQVNSSSREVLDSFPEVILYFSEKTMEMTMKWCA